MYKYKLIIIIATVYFVSSCDDQNSNENNFGFVKTFVGGESHNKGHCSFITDDNGFIVFSSVYISNQSYDIMILKTDSLGNEIWRNVIGDNDIDESLVFVNGTIDGGYIITGNKSQVNSYDNSLMILKVDSEGNLLWNSTNDYSLGWYESGTGIAQSDDGGYYILGQYFSILETSGRNIFLLKIDSEGNQLWVRLFGGEYSDYSHNIILTYEGDLVLFCTLFRYLNGATDFWLIKTDSEGNEEWNKLIGTDGYDWAGMSQQTSDGGYVIVGYTSSLGTQNDFPDIWLIKTDSEGNVEWNKTYGGISREEAYSVRQTSDDGFIITGITRTSMSPGDEDVLLIKTDSEGNKEWMREIGGSSIDVGNSVIEIPNRGYLVTGYTNSTNGTRILLIKTDLLGNTVSF